MTILALSTHTAPSALQARLAYVEEQAYAAWEYLLDRDFGASTNGLLMEAATIALSGTLLQGANQKLQETLIDLAEDLRLNLRDWLPFNLGRCCSELAVMRMVAIIALAAARRDQSSAFLTRFLSRFPEAQSECTARVRMRALTIDKSTGNSIAL